MLKAPLSITIPRNYQVVEGMSFFCFELGSTQRILTCSSASDLAALISKKESSLVIFDVRDADYSGGRIFQALEFFIYIGIVFFCFDYSTLNRSAWLHPHSV